MFSDHATWVGKAFTDRPYHNTGLYNIDGNGAYPANNTGVEGVTKIASDMGRFKAPSLRNVAVTAPYMHDGSIATLEEVLDHYVAGGRTIESGPNAGVGRTNPFKDPLIVPLVVTPEERADVIEFLKTAHRRRVPPRPRSLRSLEDSHDAPEREEARSRGRRRARHRCRMFVVDALGQAPRTTRDRAASSLRSVMGSRARSPRSATTSATTATTRAAGRARASASPHVPRGRATPATTLRPRREMREAMPPSIPRVRPIARA